MYVHIGTYYCTEYSWQTTWNCVYCTVYMRPSRNACQYEISWKCVNMWYHMEKCVNMRPPESMCKHMRRPGNVCKHMRPPGNVCKYVTTWKCV